MRAAGKSKTLRILGMLVTSLLLTSSGCAIPGSVEEFLGWRTWFHLNLDPGWIWSHIEVIAYFILGIAFVVCLYGLIESMIFGYSIIGGFFTVGLSMMLAVVIVLLFPSMLDKAVDFFLPSWVTIDAIIEALHWNLGGGFTDLILTGWAASVTIMLPFAVKVTGIILWITSIITIGESIIHLRVNGIKFLLAVFIGYGLFLFLFGVEVAIFKEIYPSIDFPGVSEFVNFFYLVGLIAIGYGCLYRIPKRAFQTYYREAEQPRKRDATHNRRRDWSAIFGIPYEDPGNGGRRSNAQSHPPKNGGEIVEGKFRDVTPDQLHDGSGSSNTKQLPAITGNGDGNGKGSKGDPKKPPPPPKGGKDKTINLPENTTGDVGTDTKSGSTPDSDDPNAKGSSKLPPIDTDKTTGSDQATASSETREPKVQGSKQLPPIDDSKQRQIRQKGDQSKKKVHNLTRTAQIVTSVVAPEAAIVTVPLIEGLGQAGEGAIEKKTQKKIEKETRKNQKKKRDSRELPPI